MSTVAVPDVLVGREMPQRTVRSALIVIDTPGFDLCFGVLDRQELMDVQALIPQPPVKRFNERVFHGFTWANEIELYTTTISPVFEGARHELGAVVDGDRAW